jgi:hypothetical protein
VIAVLVLVIAVAGVIELFLGLLLLLGSGWTVQQARERMGDRRTLGGGSVSDLDSLLIREKVVVLVLVLVVALFPVVHAQKVNEPRHRRPG